MEGHVVADKYAIADSKLQGKALIIRRPDADRCASFFGHLIISVDHAKELGFLYRELLFDDVDTPCLELAFEGNHQVVVRDRRPGVRSRGSFEGFQAFTVDIFCTTVSNKRPDITYPPSLVEMAKSQLVLLRCGQLASQEQSRDMPREPPH